MKLSPGAKATLPNGITVEFLAVSRRTLDEWRDGNLDARPAWRPDGAAYLSPLPLGYLSPAYSPQPDFVGFGQRDEIRSFEGRGARTLLFRISGPPNAEIDVFGYVPAAARQGVAKPYLHGRALPFRGVIPDLGEATMQTEIVVDDRKDTRYRLAVATGAWETVASVPLKPNDPRGKTILARGKWGTLRQDAVELDQLRKAWSHGKMGGYSGPGPSVRYDVDESEPRRLATRLRFIDDQGRSEYATGVDAWQKPFPICVKVETRPYAWVEFSGVHYDPDPAKWPRGHWGEEGEKAEARSGDAVLRAIIEPTADGGRRVYAPDGKLWRNRIGPEGILWRVGHEMGGSKSDLLADFQLGPQEAINQGVAQIHAFASEGDHPGQGLGERLDAQGGGFRRSISPYVQFAVYQPLPWKKVGEIAPPSPREIDLLAKEGSKPVSYLPSLWIIAEAAGHADVLGVEGAVPGRKNVVVWPVREPGTWVRVMVRTRDGRRYNAGAAIPNVAGAKHTEALFTPDGAGDVLFRTSVGFPSRPIDVSLRDVAAFEIETQDFAPPVYLVAKIPPPSP